jgi:hypothetical protein
MLLLSKALLILIPLVFDGIQERDIDATGIYRMVYLGDDSACIYLDNLPDSEGKANRRNRLSEKSYEVRKRIRGLE